MVGGAASEEEDGADDTEIPGLRLAKWGGGGGGIDWESVRIRGMLEDAIRCALKGLGNAGGESSSCSVSVSVPSSERGGETLSSEGIMGELDGAASTEVPATQRRRKFVIMKFKFISGVN